MCSCASEASCCLPACSASFVEKGLLPPELSALGLNPDHNTALFVACHSATLALPVKHVDALQEHTQQGLCNVIDAVLT